MRPSEVNEVGEALLGRWWTRGMLVAIISFAVLVIIAKPVAASVASWLIQQEANGIQHDLEHEVDQMRKLAPTPTPSASP